MHASQPGQPTEQPAGRAACPRPARSSETARPRSWRGRLGLGASALLATTLALTAAPAVADDSAPAGLGDLGLSEPGGSLGAGLTPGFRYVALGDSYSAGPLVPQQRPDLIGCLRSTNNYPAFLATYLKLPGYVDVTCSGAETTDMRSPQTTIVPGPRPAPQLDAVTRGTDLVTLGIGGNDYGLFGSMISTCEEVRASDPDGAPCRDHYTVNGVDTKKRDARRIQARVGRVVREIRARAPRAEVAVLGYPRLLPERGTCAAVPFATGDYAWGNQVERLLNRSLKRAAANNGARYVDLYPASRSHDACAGDQAWINGSEIKPLRAANFHPFLRGMRGVSRAAYRQITGERAPFERVATRFHDPQLPPLTPEQLTHLAQLLQDQITP
jgi:lysophospholipase L1-like esterase